MKKCKCMEKLIKRLEKKFGSSVELTNAVFNGNGTWFPHLKFKYHPKNKDGRESKRFNSSYIYNEFCSICGTKI